ncbi:cysteine peptidase family C39 domain-containing protein [Diplocloster modestus]|uniref:BtrH N-terminal domain-containing protein n=1 Tax=Diplocloster modestus TaxID=2850322 RepID=A0ABS6KE96_9FIRM|nr:hypothetical protein [Diplocloster modestus]MBU9728816.1 BtrH N-terminal domain-containing protein [Diplocloster modestus]
MNIQKIELHYIQVEKGYGGNQDRFRNFLMKMGGCAAITACDICIYLAQRTDEWKRLYPSDEYPVTAQQYEEFGMQMKRYLHPRVGGVSRLSMYTEGFDRYAEDCGVGLSWDSISGTAGYEEAEAFVCRHLDAGMPVAYLMLRHENREFEDINWHWFVLTGYERAGDNFRIVYATYGQRRTADFKVLWNTGKEERGGMLAVREIRSDP